MVLAKTEHFKVATREIYLYDVSKNSGSKYSG
jgi:hypothetical protein